MIKWVLKFGERWFPSLLSELVKKKKKSKGKSFVGTSIFFCPAQHKRKKIRPRENKVLRNKKNAGISLYYKMTEENGLLRLQGCICRTYHDAGDSCKVQLVDVLRAASSSLISVTLAPICWQMFSILVEFILLFDLSKTSEWWFFKEQQADVQAQKIREKMVKAISIWTLCAET